MLEQMLDYLTPETLAAIITDLTEHDGFDAHRKIGYAEKVAKALVANVGRIEADEMLKAAGVIIEIDVLTKDMY